MRFCAVSPMIWNRTFRKISTNAKLVAMYIATCPSRTGEGLFRWSADHAAIDLNLTYEQVLETFVELTAIGVAEYDDDAEVVLYLRGLIDQPLKHGVDRDSGELRRNRAMKNAVAKFLEVPSSPLKEKFLMHAQQYAPDLVREILLAEPVWAARVDVHDGSEGICVRCGTAGVVVERQADGTLACGDCREEQDVDGDADEADSLLDELLEGSD